MRHGVTLRVAARSRNRSSQRSLFFVLLYFWGSKVQTRLPEPTRVPVAHPRPGNACVTFC